MPIYLGTQSVSSIYVGTQEISSVYFGTNLVFSSALEYNVSNYWQSPYPSYIEVVVPSGITTAYCSLYANGGDSPQSGNYGEAELRRNGTTILHVYSVDLDFPDSQSTTFSVNTGDRLQLSAYENTGGTSSGYLRLT